MIIYRRERGGRRGEKRSSAHVEISGGKELGKSLETTREEIGWVAPGVHEDLTHSHAKGEYRLSRKRGKIVGLAKILGRRECH